MPISEFCNREVIISQRDETILEAAKLMRERNVGTLIVVDRHEGHNLPFGIVTDRDLVIEIIALEADPTFTRVEEIMAPELASVKDICGVFEAIQYMRSKRVDGCR